MKKIAVALALSLAGAAIAVAPVVASAAETAASDVGVMGVKRAAGPYSTLRQCQQGEEQAYRNNVVIYNRCTYKQFGMEGRGAGYYFTYNG